MSDFFVFVFGFWAPLLRATQGGEDFQLIHLPVIVNKPAGEEEDEQDEEDEGGDVSYS